MNPRIRDTWPAWADLLPHLRTLDLATTDDEELAWQACRAAAYLLRRGERPRQPRHDRPAVPGVARPSRTRPPGRRCGRRTTSRRPGRLGRPRDAVALERELHDHYVATYGDDHPDTLTSAGNLAIRLAALGEHEQARALDEDTLARRRRVLGDDHPDTLRSANNLADRLAELGEHEQARALDEDTLTRRRRVLGDDHPDTLTSANNLADRLAALGEHEQARDLAEDTLTRRRRVLGDDHPDTLRSADNLATDLAALGEHQQARALDEDTLARRRRVLGEDHPDTLTSASNLATELAGLGELQQARKLAEDTLARRRRVLGDDHPDTLTPRLSTLPSTPRLRRCHERGGEPVRREQVSDRAERLGCRGSRLGGLVVVPAGEAQPVDHVAAASCSPGHRLPVGAVTAPSRTRARRRRWRYRSTDHATIPTIPHRAGNSPSMATALPGGCAAGAAPSSVRQHRPPRLETRCCRVSRILPHAIGGEHALWQVGGLLVSRVGCVHP